VTADGTWSRYTTPSRHAPTGAERRTHELLRGDGVDTLLATVAPYDARGSFTRDAAVLELTVEALDLAQSPGRDLLEYEGLRGRYLPEIELRGRTERRAPHRTAPPVRPYATVGYRGASWPCQSDLAPPCRHGGANSS
jgi:hypothetical protein